MIVSSVFSKEDSSKKDNSVKRKFRFQRTPKRKGFYGKRPQEIAEEKALICDKMEASTSGHAGCETEVDQNVATDRLPPTPVKIQTAQILENSAFKEFKEREGTFTRQKPRKLGFTEAQTSVEKAHGFKLQDSVLLSDYISAAANCSS